MSVIFYGYYSCLYCTNHSSAGFSPHKTRLLIGTLKTEEHTPFGIHKQYLENWNKEMEDAYATNCTSELKV